MKYTVEQFLERFMGVIMKAAYAFARQNKLFDEDFDDLVSELKMRAIAWFRRYPDVIEQAESEAHVGGLLKNHLNHKGMEYLPGRVTRHWGVLSLDLNWENDPSEHQAAWETVLQAALVDPKAERDMRRVEDHWVYQVIDMLPTIDQEIICKRYGLRGYDEVKGRDMEYSSEQIQRAMERLRKAEKAFREGRRVITFRDYQPRGYSQARLEEKRKTKERILGHLRKQGTSSTRDIATALDYQATYFVYDHLRELLKEGKIRKVGFKRASGMGPNTRLYALADPLTSPNENAVEPGSEAA